MSVPAALPFARLVVVDDPVGRSAPLNMAMDEALLDRLADAPLLRIYRWAGPSVSIGCFDPAEPVARRWPEHELVRRWTGGGTVEHGRDLTFSLLVPRPFRLALIPATESYRVIHAAVADAFARVGHPVATHETISAPDRTASRACFENPVPFDLLVSDRKVAGGAQRRTRRGLLHQGSVQDARQGSGWLSALAKALPGAFGRSLEHRQLVPAELDAAEGLVAAKYGSKTWLRRF